MDDTGTPRNPHEKARRTRARRPMRAALLAGVAGGALALAPPAIAQPDDAPGATFAGLVIPAPLQRADIAITSATGRAWRAGPAQRLYLDGEVRVTIGDHRFVAGRAVCWFEPVQREGAAGVVEPLWQVALYLDDVADPAADAAVAQSADRLLVTAIVSGEISVRPDVFRDGRPTEADAADYIAQAEARLARYLALVAAGQAAVDDPAGPQIVDSQRLEPLPTPERIDPASLLPSAV
ncbi:MAG: hypothetical protein ACF8QF_13495, partial [Phycisphaerales bacterium]